MSLESNVAKLKKELETGRKDSKKAYRINHLTMDIVEDTVAMLPKEEYVRREIIPTLEKASNVIKISSTRGGFAKHMGGFVNCVKERIEYLRNYPIILKDILF